MNSFSATSTRPPPTSLLLSRMAVRISPMDRSKARRRLGSTVTWYWRTNPPTPATSETPRTAVSSYLRNQSWIERSSPRS